MRRFVAKVIPRAPCTDNGLVFKRLFLPSDDETIIRAANLPTHLDFLRAFKSMTQNGYTCFTQTADRYDIGQSSVEVRTPLPPFIAFIGGDAEWNASISVYEAEDDDIWGVKDPTKAIAASPATQRDIESIFATKAPSAWSSRLTHDTALFVAPVQPHEKNPKISLDISQVGDHASHLVVYCIGLSTDKDPQVSQDHHTLTHTFPLRYETLPEGPAKCSDDVKEEVPEARLPDHLLAALDKRRATQDAITTQKAGIALDMNSIGDEVAELFRVPGVGVLGPLPLVSWFLRVNVQRAVWEVRKDVDIDSGVYHIMCNIALVLEGVVQACSQRGGSAPGVHPYAVLLEVLRPLTTALSEAVTFDSHLARFYSSNANRRRIAKPGREADTTTTAHPFYAVLAVLVVELQRSKHPAGDVQVGVGLGWVMQQVREARETNVMEG